MFNFSLLRITVLFICLLPAFVFSDESRIGGNFELTSQLNQPFTSTDAHGKVVILFFGFTHCPDVCPNTLGTIQTVLGQLGERAKHVQPIFVTVDPERDKPEILHKYLQYFNNDFIGLTGTPEEIDKVVNQFQGFYSYDGDLASSQYTVDHTSNLYIINTAGEVTNIIPYGLPPQAITNSIEKLLDGIDS
ncbi:MAG: redoxin domain-containing protein [Gammaproteobacteria bacterium]|nr:MAG: redoxin domain-containing protein [Gammaproteobacteria bacterium]